MKKILAIGLLGILIIAPSSQARDAVGSAFGAFSTAHSLGMGNGNLLVGAGLGDDRNVFLGRLNYGLSKFTNGSIKLALVDPDYPGSDTRIALGADFQYQFMVMDDVTRSKFEMAAGGLFEYYDSQNGSAILLGGTLVGSYPFLMENGSHLSPYGRFNARIERLSYDAGRFTPSGSDTNLEFGLNLGVCWEASRTVNLYGEFQLDGNDGLFLGAEFDVF